MSARPFHLLLLLLLWASMPARATLWLDAETQTVELAGHMEMLLAPAPGTTVEAVAAGRMGEFVALPGQLVSGFGKSREIWLRFTVGERGDEARVWHLRVLPPYLDQVQLFLPDGDVWREVVRGAAADDGNGPLSDRGAVFPLRLMPDSPRTVYLRIEHEGSLNAYLSLYAPAERQKLLQIENLLFGLYFGAVVVLLLINLLNWHALRELIFLEFSAYLAVRGLYFFFYDGLASQWLMPGSPELARDIMRFLLTLVVASIAPVLVRVLDMPRQYPRLAKLCYGLGALALLFSVSVASGDFARFGGLMSVIVLLLTVIGTGVAAMQLRQNRRLGLLLLVTMLILMGGLGVSAMAGLGVHTSSMADLYGGQISAFTVFVALHFAVAMRVLEIKQALRTSERATRLAAELAEQERGARREQSDFVAMLFHEIKTPLAEIASAATVLEHLDDGTRRETGSRYDAIHGAVDRLNLLVEQNLARDRQGLEVAHLARRPVDLAALARVVLDSFGVDRQHDFALDAPADLPHLAGDPEFLRVALANLVDNALKYAGGRGPIRVRACQVGSHLQLSVRDTGPGMDADSAAHAFDRYWRGGGSGRLRGAGLGLYLVWRIVEAHGGWVDLDTVPGRGCCFTMNFPLDGIR